MARERMHDSLWPHIKKDLDDGYLKGEIISKYKITQISLNRLLIRKQYDYSLSKSEYSKLEMKLLEIDPEYYVKTLKLKTYTQRSYVINIINALQRYVSSFGILPTRNDLARYTSISISAFNKYVRMAKLGHYFERNSRMSILVRKLCRILEKNQIEYEINNRQLLKPYEVDIWVPKYNIGFEVDPNSTHSTNHLGQLRRPIEGTYHQFKSLLAFEKGIRLVHLYDWDQISEAEILNYLHYKYFDFSNLQVDLNKLLITKADLNKMHYYSYKVVGPRKHYVYMNTPYSEFKPGSQTGKAGTVWDAGYLKIKK